MGSDLYVDVVKAFMMGPYLVLINWAIQARFKHINLSTLPSTVSLSPLVHNCATYWGGLCKSEVVTLWHDTTAQTRPKVDFSQWHYGYLIKWMTLASLSSDRWIFILWKTMTVYASPSLPETLFTKHGIVTHMAIHLSGVFLNCCEV